MPAQLLSLSNGPTLLLDKPILLIGRSEECDIQLNSKKISRKHCVIAQVRDHLVIRDLGSTNGIRVNGQRLLESPLRTGDELTIGNFLYRVHVDAVVEMLPLPPSQPPVDPPLTPGFTWSSVLEAVNPPIPIPDNSGTTRALPPKP